MKVGGFLKFSTLDYPGKISAVIFTQGCPLRCIYCHNPDFQEVSTKNGVIFEEILDFLKTRIGLLEAVVFSGGEPLLQDDLRASILAVKKLGFLVGLHTSGAIPEVFGNILDIVDWVGFDIKSDFQNYEKITRISCSGESAKCSIEKLFDSSVKHEVRTTLDTRYISNDNLVLIAEYLKSHGVKKWVLQECILRKSGASNEALPLPSVEILENIAKIIDIELRRA